MMNVYTINDVVRVYGQLSDLDGTPGDPGGVVVKVKAPDGSITSKTYLTDAAVVRTAPGAFYLDVVGDQEGIWHYRFESSVSRQAAAEGRFTVRESQFN